MCFGGKPKIKKPEVQTAIPAAPIEDQTPTVVGGADSADASRDKKRKTASGALSLFQIQLLPGVTTTSADEPGAQGGV